MAMNRHMLRNFFIVIFLGLIFIGAAPNEPVKKNHWETAGNQRTINRQLKNKKQYSVAKT